MNDNVLITFDIDWSPDWILAEVRDLLLQSDARATWFVTHASPMLEEIRSEPKRFELGLHPNCLPGSTQGKDERSVLGYVKDLVPEAVSMRPHGLYQSSAFLGLSAREFGIRYDTSILLPGVPNIIPHQLNCGGTTLWRIPFYWEDDINMMDSAPRWELSEAELNAPGLKIFNFHPFHIVLNTVDYNLYETLKSKVPLPKWDPDFIAPHRNDGPGPRTLFMQLLEINSRRQGGELIREVVPAFLGSEDLGQA